MTQNQLNPPPDRPGRKPVPISASKAAFRALLLLAFVALIITVQMLYRASVAKHIVFVATDIGQVKIRAFGRDGMVTSVQVAGSATDIGQLISFTTASGGSLQVAAAMSLTKGSGPVVDEDVASISIGRSGATAVVFSTNPHNADPQLFGVHALKIRDAEITLPCSQQVYEKTMDAVVASPAIPGPQALPAASTQAATSKPAPVATPAPDPAASPAATAPAAAATPAGQAAPH